VELGGHGCDFVVGELRHPLAQVLVFFGQHARDKGFHGFLPRRWRGCRGLGCLSCSAGAVVGTYLQQGLRPSAAAQSAASPIPASSAMSSSTTVASASSSRT